jgi:hypothetical protein
MAILDKAYWLRIQADVRVQPSVSEFLKLKREAYSQLVKPGPNIRLTPKVEAFITIVFWAICAPRCSDALLAHFCRISVATCTCGRGPRSAGAARDRTR